MANGAISTVLWPGAKETVGADLLLGGILAYKSGYHGPRNWMKQHYPNDYSIQLDIDKQGPGDLGSAIDLTFRSAQAGNYNNIAKYSKRLYQAGVDKDPRAYPMREFQGNIDSDTTVEGWSYYRGYAITTSDKSHLWHIHISIHRKYINDEDAMRSILSIWNGDDDMPLSDDDIKRIAKAVWDADVIPNIWGDPNLNPNIRAKNALVEIGNDANEIKAKLET